MTGRHWCFFTKHILVKCSCMDNVWGSSVGIMDELLWPIKITIAPLTPFDPVPSPSPSFQVSRWSRSSDVAWQSSSSGQQLRPSASGRHCTAPRPSCWPRLPPAHTPPPSAPLRPWPCPRPWFTTPSCTTSRKQPGSSPTTHWAWRAQTVWTPACPRGTTQPAPQTTCQGSQHAWTETTRLNLFHCNCTWLKMT